MGLLDEAIREHLDLKRKRGGDPTELARQEQEALGPAVREAAPAGDETAAGAVLADHDAPVAVPDPEAPPAHHPAPDDDLALDPEAPGPADIAEPPAERSEPPREPTPAGETGFQPEEPEPEPPARDPEPVTSQETAVFDVDDVFAEEEKVEEPPTEEAQAGEDDVLEETPDFLQETPEHDRLWFEQKPPKDFDFDG
jgi:hypothetical protein